MSVAPRIFNMFNKITTMFHPKPHVVGLGRWGSTVSKKKSSTLWQNFHDMCNYDNCYTTMFSVVHFTNNGVPLKPTPPLTPLDSSEPVEKRVADIPNLPVHYALEMPRNASSIQN